MRQFCGVLSADEKEREIYRLLFLYAARLAEQKHRDWDDRDRKGRLEQ